MLRVVITRVQIWAKPRCQQCQGDQESVPKTSSMHKCEWCLILQEVANYPVFYRGIITVNVDRGNETTLALTNAAVFNYIIDNGISHDAHEGRTIEEHIMERADTCVLVNSDDQVVAFVQDRLPGETHADPTVPTSSNKAEGKAQTLLAVQTPPADLSDQAPDQGKVLSAVVSGLNLGEISVMGLESAEDPLNRGCLFEDNM